MRSVADTRALFSQNKATATKVPVAANDSQTAPPQTRSWRLVASRLAIPVAIIALGVVCGSAVAVARTNGLYLCASLIVCALILFEFRFGVVLLILLMPISGSYVFPHALLGITGLNPVNLLLFGTLASYLLSALSDGSIRRFIPRPLLWLYVAPILVAGVLGTRHVDEIPSGFIVVMQSIEFDSVSGYVRDLVLKPMFWVLFALLVGAAVSKSYRPERFLGPMLMSIWLMGLLVIVFVLRSGIGLGALASSSSREFLSTLGLHANDLGRLYAIAYALLLFTWAASTRMTTRIVLLASIGMVMAALIMTFSRGAFVGFIVANVMFLLGRRNAKTMAAIGLAAALALLVLPGAIYDRVTTGFDGDANDVSAGRIEGIWEPQLPEVFASPVYGNGLGSILWSRAMREGDRLLVPMVTHPHNAYLQALEDMGIVGLVLLCAYYVHVWKEFRARAADPELSNVLRGFYQGAAVGLVSFLIAAITDGSLAPRPEQAFLWFAIGMMYGQRPRTASEPSLNHRGTAVHAT